MKAWREKTRTRILPVDANARRTREERDAAHRAEQDDAVITRGLWAQGIWDPALKEFMGGPGIETLERLIAECRAIIDAEQQRQSMTWPARCRYIGEPGRAELNGTL